METELIDQDTNPAELLDELLPLVAENFIEDKAGMEAMRIDKEGHTLQ
jgi:hypothetical protein